MSRTNLLVIFADEHPGAATRLGDAWEHTPHRDALARGGSRFVRAFADGPLTAPACAGLLTPGAPARPETGIARLLGRAGYRCGYSGRFRPDQEPRTRFVPPGPGRLGCDHFWAAWIGRAPQPGRDLPFDRRYEPALQTYLALEFLADHHRRHAERPFALFVAWGPAVAPRVPLPPGRGALGVPYSPQRLPGPAAGDAQLGRLLRFLEENSQERNTLIAFLAGHGGAPLILRGPGVPAGKTADLPIAWPDLVPTFLGLLGQPLPAGLPGRDLSACIHGPAARPAQSAVRGHYS